MILLLLLILFLKSVEATTVIGYYYHTTTNGAMSPTFGAYPGANTACGNSPAKSPTCTAGTYRMFLGASPVGAPSPSPLAGFFPSPTPVKWWVPTNPTPTQFVDPAPTSISWSTFVSDYDSTALSLPTVPSPSGFIWTGYSPTGTVGSGAVTCSGWTTSSPSSNGIYSSKSGVQGTTACSNSFSLVCFCTGPTTLPTPAPTLPTKSPSKSPTLLPTTSPTSSPTPTPSPLVLWFHETNTNGNFNPTPSPSTNRTGLQSVCSTSSNKPVVCLSTVDMIASTSASLSTIFSPTAALTFYIPSNPSPSQYQAISGIATYGQLVTGSPFTLPTSPPSPIGYWTGVNINGIYSTGQSCASPTGDWASSSSGQLGYYGTTTRIGTSGFAFQTCDISLSRMCGCYALFTSSPSKSPSKSPTFKPSLSPTLPTRSPSNSPTLKPTTSPTASPTRKPTTSPTSSPTRKPTNSPTSSPTKKPTTSPTKSPTLAPTTSPSLSPTKSPEYGLSSPIVLYKGSPGMGIGVAANFSSIGPTICSSSPARAPTCWPGSDTPLVSTSTQDMVDIFTGTPSTAIVRTYVPSPGGVEYTDTTPSADFSTLFSGGTLNLPSNQWWSGSSRAGTFLPSKTCGDWSSVDSALNGEAGDTTGFTASLFACNSEAPDLVCACRANYVDTITYSPSRSPTLPTKSPTKSPTLSPTVKPTSSPTIATRSPSRSPTVSPTSSISVIFYNGGSTTQNGNFGGTRTATTITCLASPNLPPVCTDPNQVKAFLSFNSSDEVLELFGYGGYTLKTYSGGLYTNTIPLNPGVTFSQLFTGSFTLNLPVSGVWWFGSGTNGDVSAGGNCQSWNSASSSDVGTLGSTTSLSGGAYPCNAAATFICACLGIVPPTLSPTSAPTQPTSQPTLVPTSSPTLCMPSYDECETASVDTLFSPDPDESIPHSQVVWYGASTFFNQTSYANASAILMTFEHPVCHFPNSENPLVVLDIINMPFWLVVQFLTCANPGRIVAYTTIQIRNVTGPIFDVLSWSSPGITLQTIPDVTTFLITEENGSPSVVGIIDAASLTRFTVAYSIIALNTPNSINFVAYQSPELHLFSASSLRTSLDDHAGANGVQFLFQELDVVMEIDLRNFTGVQFVEGPRTFAVTSCPNLERIRLDSWEYAAETDQFTIFPNSARFNNSFGAACSPSTQTGDAILTLIQNCTAPSNVPDHDYDVCLTPISTQCFASTFYDPTCWVSLFTQTRFVVQSFISSNLKLVDCVLDANHFFTLTVAFELRNVRITQSLIGLERIQTANFRVYDSVLPAFTELNRLNTSNCTTFSNVSGVVTMQISLLQNCVELSNMPNLANFTLSPGSLGITTFRFSSNPTLVTKFPSCNGVMNQAQFLANCFSGGGSLAPTSRPTTLPTHSPTTKSPTMASPTASPTPAPVLAPTVPPTPPFTCTPPTTSPICLNGSAEANFADIVYTIYPEAYFVAPNATLYNSTVDYSMPVLVLVYYNTTACVVPDPPDPGRVLFDVVVKDTSYAIAYDFFRCKNDLHAWEIQNSLVIINVGGDDFNNWFVSIWSAPVLSFQYNPDVSNLRLWYQNFASLTITINPLLQLFSASESTTTPNGWDLFELQIHNNPELRLFNLSQFVTTESNSATSVIISITNNPGLMCIDLKSFTGVMTMLGGGTRALDFSTSPAMQRIHLDSFIYRDDDDTIKFPSDSPRFTNSFPWCPATTQVGGLNITAALQNCTGASDVPSHDYVWACVNTIYPACESSGSYDPGCWISSHVVTDFLVSGYESTNLSKVDCVLDDNYFFDVSDSFVILSSNITDSLKGVERVRTTNLRISNTALPDFFKPEEFEGVTTSTYVTSCVSGAKIVEVPMNIVSFWLTSCDFTTNLTLGQGYSTSTFVFSDNPALEANYPLCVGTLSLTQMLARCFPAGTSLSPTQFPTRSPSLPTSSPTTGSPTPPTMPTNTPTLAPINSPTNAPFTDSPTPGPTKRPTIASPTHRPTNPTPAPTFAPTTQHPTLSPTAGPTESPTPQVCLVEIL